MSPVSTPKVLNSVNKTTSDMPTSSSSSKSRSRAETYHDDPPSPDSPMDVDEDGHTSRSDLNVSPTSSTTSAKENSVPKKKKKSNTNRNLMITYSPKKRKRPSSATSASSNSTVTVKTEPEVVEKQGRRGRPTSSKSGSVVSAFSESDKRSTISSDREPVGSELNCSRNTVSETRSTSSSSSRPASRKSDRTAKERVKVTEEIATAAEKIFKKNWLPARRTLEDTSIVSSSSSALTEDGLPQEVVVKKEETRVADITLTSSDDGDVEDEGEEDDRKSRSESASKTSSKISDKRAADKKKEPEKESDASSDSGSDGDDDDDSDEDGEVYVVERIDDKKVLNGTTFYFIKWKGWHESSNTWEPFDNLNGCAELLEEFERTYAEKRGRRRAAGIGRGRFRDSDDEDDKEKVIQTTQSHMRSYGILPEWPADKEPLSVEGVIHVDGVLTYVVKRKVRLSGKKLDRSNAVLVNAETFKLSHPQLVIDFYSSRVLWSENAKDTEEQANIAAQVSLLCQNKGSVLGQIIANDMNRQMREDIKRSEKPPVEEDILDAETQQIEPEQIGVEENGRTVDDEEDTQMITTEEDGDGDSLDRDGFGLPEDLVETDISSCSMSDFEYEGMKGSELKEKNKPDVLDIY